MSDIPKCIRHPDRDATCQGGYYLMVCIECYREGCDQLHRIEAGKEQFVPFEDRDPIKPQWEH